MKLVVLVLAISLIAAGLLAISIGIPIKEFSTGNTLIMTGMMGVCTGTVMFALWILVRELKNIARRLGDGAAEVRGEVRGGPVLSPMRAFASDESILRSHRDQSAVSSAGGLARSVSPPPWQDEAFLHDHPIAGPMFPEDAAPPPPPLASPRPKRNLLFSSSREGRAPAQSTSEALPSGPLSSDLHSRPPDMRPVAQPTEPSPFNYDGRQAEQAKPGEVLPQHRRWRTPTAAAEAHAAERNANQPAVTVVKSGIVNSMAYSLYSDGSIEAEMPEGMMRFASVDELRVHLEQQS